MMQRLKQSGKTEWRQMGTQWDGNNNGLFEVVGYHKEVDTPVGIRSTNGREATRMQVYAGSGSSPTNANNCNELILALSCSLNM